MKLQHVVGVLSLFALCSVATASIIDGNVRDDGSGAIMVASFNLEMQVSPLPPKLTFEANQYRQGNLNGEVLTDSPLDPNLLFPFSMLNNTNFGWDGYHIQVTLGGPFSLNYATAPTNWKTTITGPSAVGDGNYVGTIDYAMATGGSPVLIGQTGEFGFEMGLDGLNLYGFGLAMAPSPEPATLVLLGAGAVGLVIRRRRRK